jgi:hypothetical protein
MSEVKTNEPVKQEGEFKIKKKTPKKLTTQSSEPVKVNLKEPLVEVPAEVTKVVIPKEETKIEDAIQVGETTKVLVEEPSGDSTQVGEQVQEPVEDVKEFTPIKEVEVTKVEAEVKEALRDEKVLGKQLPENIEKLVNFMEDTGGTVEDYVRLNADYSNVDDKTLLKEYYKKNKPYLDNSDVELHAKRNLRLKKKLQKLKAF